MKKNSRISNLLKIQIISLFVFVSSFLVTSCNKENSLIGYAEGDTFVEVALVGSQYGSTGGDGGLVKTASTGTKKTSNAIETPQDFSLALGNGYVLDAQLVPESSTTVKSSLTASSSSPLKGGVSTFGTTDIQKLGKGIRYRVIVFDNNGNYLTHEDFENGTADQKGFKVNEGSTYSFVAYSLGTTAALPALIPEVTSLENCAISGTSDFMYFKESLTVQSGTNKLNIVLKHKFSEISVVINASQHGTLDQAQGILEPHHSSPIVNLKNGNISYGGLSPYGKIIPFVISDRSYGVGFPTTICAPYTEAGVLTLNNIKIDGVVKSGVKVEGLKITPGVRYNLTITINKTIKIDDVDWAVANLIFNPGTNQFEFASHPKEYGTYWFFNSPYPMTTYQTGLGNNTNIYDPAKDPCKRVLGNWRTPSITEANSIFTNLLEADYDGVLGYFCGITNGVAPTGDDRRNYIFIPKAGYYVFGRDPEEKDPSDPNYVPLPHKHTLVSNGFLVRYWTSTPAGISPTSGPLAWTYASLGLGVGGLLPQENTVNLATPIRCIKAD